MTVIYIAAAVALLITLAGTIGALFAVRRSSEWVQQLEHVSEGRGH